MPRAVRVAVTITFQNYFRLYTKLSGMTGTALTEEEEFGSIYKLDVVEIPTNRPLARQDDPMMKSPPAARTFSASASISALYFFILSANIFRASRLSKLLTKEGIKHNLLNAKNHEREAEIAVPTRTGWPLAWHSLICSITARYLAGSVL